MNTPHRRWRVEDPPYTASNQPAVRQSAILLTELDDVLHRPKFAVPLHRAQLSANTLVADIARIAVLVIPVDLPAPVCRDPDDDVLAAALGGDADAIVTGDRDLLVLERFGDIPIIDPSQGVGLVEQSLRFG